MMKTVFSGLLIALCITAHAGKETILDHFYLLQLENICEGFRVEKSGKKYFVTDPSGKRSEMFEPLEGEGLYLFFEGTDQTLALEMKAFENKLNGSVMVLVSRVTFDSANVSSVQAYEIKDGSYSDVTSTVVPDTHGKFIAGELPPEVTPEWMEYCSISVSFGFMAGNAVEFRINSDLISLMCDEELRKKEGSDYTPCNVHLELGGLTKTLYWNADTGAFRNE